MKKTYVYAKEKHFKGPFLRFMANRNNIILVDVNKDLKLSIQKLAEVLKKGKNLMIFPEGTRTLTGKLGDFKQTFRHTQPGIESAGYTGGNQGFL